MITAMLPLTNLPLAGYFGFEYTRAPKPRALRKLRNWMQELPRSVGLRRSAQAVFVDAQGVWSWAVGDSLTPAARLDSMGSWFARNPGSDVTVWTSAQLLQNFEAEAATAELADGDFESRVREQFVSRHGSHAQQWPTATWQTRAGRGASALAGMDLSVLWSEAEQHDVQVQAVTPWWYHAYKTALQCVSSLRSSGNAAVCIVEGDQIAWIACSHGAMTSIRQRQLAAPTIAALACEMRSIRNQSSRHSEPTVILGQGIKDGADTRLLIGLVLGRLDSLQPPVWLRPDTHFERC